MKKILITGVAGFLGVNLALKLLENEDNIVFGIDNFASSSISNMYRILKNDRFNFLQQNLDEGININVDEIYHLAGFGDLIAFSEKKCEISLQYIKNINSILEYTKFSGAKLLCVSDYCDYTDTNNKNKLYLEMQKYINELILEYSLDYKIDAKIAQVDKIYGPNVLLSDNRFVPSTIIKAFNNETIVLDCDKSFYYTYSEDAVLGFIKIMENYLDNKVIDVSSPNLSYNSDIAKLIVNFTKSKSKIIIEDNVQKYPPYTPNVDILNSSLNFRCKTPILEGISKTIDYIKLMFFT